MLVNRGSCTFPVKATNAQNAGAAGLLIANNTAGSLSPGGAAPGITIPVLGITQAAGNQLRAAAPLSAVLMRDPLSRMATQRATPGSMRPPRTHRAHRSPIGILH